MMNITATQESRFHHRRVTCLAIALFAALSMTMQASRAVADDAPAPKKPDTRYLWPDGAPLAKGTKDADKPILFVFKAPKAKANGAGVVICPGGGYGGHAMDHEGVQIAKFFNSFGVTAFVLRYRLNPYRHPVPLMDAQRALRIVRHDAKKYGIVRNRIGIMGFSAGGHLASTAGTHFDDGKPDSADAIGEVGCRPDFLILCYPVVSFTEPFTHKGSRRNLLGDKPDPKLAEHLSNEKQVTAKTPPTFLFHTNEDKGVPAENSVSFYLALRKAGVPAELHIYQKGPHGVGLMPGDPVLSTWSARLADWMKTNGFLSDAKRAAVKGRVMIDGEPLSFGTIAFHSMKPGNGHPSAVARVRRGGFLLAEADGPVIGTCRVVVTRLAGQVISDKPTLSDSQTFGDKRYAASSQLEYEVQAGKNELEFELKSK